MEIKFRQRLLTTVQLRQALYEQIGDLEQGYGLHLSLGATLFMNPVDRYGDPVLLRAHDGKVIKKICSDGPYDCNADNVLRIVRR